MISQKEVNQIHKILIQKFGGSDGIRDLNLSDAAINRPYATFGGQELYPNPSEKAAAIFESIVKNHPFADGNKRTGYVLLRMILMDYESDILATEAEKYDFVIQTASGKLNYEEIKSWIEKHIK